MDSRSRSTRLRVVALVAVLIAMIGGIAGAPSPARATVGGYVELHLRACPSGWDGANIYQQCHDNPVPNRDFTLTGPDSMRYEETTNGTGRAVFGEIYAEGDVTLAEDVANPDYANYLVYCTRLDNNQPVTVEKRGNGRAAVLISLPDDVANLGVGVVCDWYYIPAAPPVANSSLEIHASSCPSDVDRNQLFDVCHHHGITDLPFTVTGPKSMNGSTAGPLGAVLFGGMAAGTWTVTESWPAGYAIYIVACSDATGAIVPFSYLPSGQTGISLEIRPDQAVTCDWYHIANPPPTATPTRAPAATATAAPAKSVTPAPTIAPVVALTGIGMPRTEWEAIHGKGTRDGDVILYEGGHYAVTFNGGVVSYIEYGWEEDGGLTPAEAQAEVEGLLPPDAEMTDNYWVFSTPNGPTAMAIARYESPELQAALGRSKLDWNGSLVVVYYLSPDTGSTDAPTEPTIERVSISPGREPGE